MCFLCQGARWDYHSTHINLLLTLYTVETNYTIFKQTAERWVPPNTQREVIFNNHFLFQMAWLYGRPKILPQLT